jgi:hypothetical protein
MVGPCLPVCTLLAVLLVAITGLEVTLPYYKP